MYVYISVTLSWHILQIWSYHYTSDKLSKQTCCPCQCQTTCMCCVSLTLSHKQSVLNYWHLFGLILMSTGFLYVTFVSPVSYCANRCDQVMGSYLCSSVSWVYCSILGFWLWNSIRRTMLLYCLLLKLRRRLPAWYYLYSWYSNESCSLIALHFNY